MKRAGSMVCCAAICAAGMVALSQPSIATGARYPWRADAATPTTLAERLTPPPGFQRLPVEAGSFAAWLRGLPLKPPQSLVRLYDGRPKFNQQVHVAVIDIDTGDRDLQQCADAIMRLRAEYLLASGRARDISFNDTKGKPQPFKGDAKDYAGFRRYLDKVFSVAGSYSLEHELRQVAPAEMQAGDVFIKGGFPGHAVLVVDMALNPASGEKRFLLLQSYMPAQDLHILKNPKAADGSPWYPLPSDKDQLVTPEWTFPPRALRRFKN
jgi:Domain of unknown function (4846)